MRFKPCTAPARVVYHRNRATSAGLAPDCTRALLQRKGGLGCVRSLSLKERSFASKEGSAQALERRASVHAIQIVDRPRMCGPIPVHVHPT